MLQGFPQAYLYELAKTNLPDYLAENLGNGIPSREISELLHVGSCSALNDIFVPHKTTEINQSPCCFEVMFRQREF